VSVKAILRDHKALFVHFTQCVNSDRHSKEKSKFNGLAKKLQLWSFITEACMLKYALRCLKQLSLYLQSRKATVIDAQTHVDDVKEKLPALKSENGKTLGKYLASFESDKHYHNVEIVKKEGDEEQFKSRRGQFYQALHENIEQRFACTDLQQAARCLCPSSWPADPITKALYGESHVASMSKSLGFSPDTTAEIVMDYSMYKRSDGKSVGEKLKSLFSVLEIMPISSAECERGFRQMNLIHSAARNRLLVLSVSDLLMIVINGPPLCHWNAQKYVVSWLKSGRHGALDKTTGVPRKDDVISHSAKLFAL